MVAMARKVDVRLPGKGNSKLPWREAGPLNHHDDIVDSDQQVVNKELSLWWPCWFRFVTNALIFMVLGEDPIWRKHKFGTSEPDRDLYVGTACRKSGL